MKNLADLAEQYAKAEALLLRLEAQPAELEAEREKLVSAEDLDAEPSAELTAVATKLSILPTKIEQAEKRLEALRASVEEENKLVASQLGQIGRDREAKLRADIILAMKPLFPRIESPEFVALLADLVTNGESYPQIYSLQFAGNGSHMVSAITKARELLAMRTFAGL